MDCIFCKIINKELPAEIIYQDHDIIAIKDINPKAPVHFLIIPQKHIESVDYLQDQDMELAGRLILAARNIAREKKLKGYKLEIHVGREAGQIIDHLHLHLLSGKPAEMP